MANQVKATPAAAKAATPAPVVPVALAVANAPANPNAPVVPLHKYAKAAGALGVGTMPKGNAKFTLGVWPRSSANPTAPAMGATPASANMGQVLWLAARQAGATATQAVTGLQIAQAMVAPATPANAAMLQTKTPKYTAQGQACGLWLQGYIGPNKGAHGVKHGILKVA